MRCMAKQTGAMPAVSPTKYRKFCRSAAEYAILQNDLHNKKSPLGEEVLKEQFILQRTNEHPVMRRMPVCLKKRGEKQRRKAKI